MSIPANVSEKDLKYWLGLSTFLKFGPKRFFLLRKCFGNMEAAYRASASELCRAGIDKKTAEEFISHRQKINVDEEMEKLEKENIQAIAIQDKNYPKLLKEIYDAPPLLYVRGQLPENLNYCLAVVGSRKYSPYGQQAAQYLAGRLAQAGLVIVSGLALGIDALAHLSCVKAGGHTVAVLGSGLDKASVYPASNRYLVEKIISHNGALISEYPFGAPPLKHHFPQRNRIISGLSLGVLVVEASLKSGALITAQSALEQNREVFAVPGSIFNDNAAGANKLIQAGAKLVNSANDIIETLSLDNIKNFVASQKIIPETMEENKILEKLNREPIHINAIAQATKLDTHAVNATLLTMELKGYVRSLGGGNYVLA